LLELSCWGGGGCCCCCCCCCGGGGGGGCCCCVFNNFNGVCTGVTTAAVDAVGETPTVRPLGTLR